VKLRDAAHGRRFLCGHGDVWQKGAKHGSHNDVFLATRVRDGHESCFGGALDV
jgi:hypothetical protein